MRVVRPSSRTGWATLGVVVVLVVASVALLTRAFLVNHQNNGRKAALALPVPSALTDTPSAPKPVLATAPVASGSAATAAITQKPPAPVTASSHPAAIVKPILPDHLFIPSIKVNTTVSAAPSTLAHDDLLPGDPRVESFGVPPDTAEGMLETTWWNADVKGDPKPRPGDPGMAVILGHTQIGAPGAFNDLASLRAGATVGVSNGKTVLKFRVIGKPHTGIPKSDGSALQGTLLHHPKDARLALITCSGHFNGHESVENTVVFLQLVGYESVGR